MSERDTHFAGFAKAVWRKMLDLKGGCIDEGDLLYPGDNESPEYEQIIAQCAYDLFVYTFNNVPEGRLWYVLHCESKSIEDRVNSLPDMPKLP